MSETRHSGLEVTPDTGPQIIPQPDADLYYNGPEESHEHTPDQLHHLNPPSLRSPGNKRSHKVVWALAVITSLCIAGALGAGLGAGLAVHRKSNPPR